MKRILKFIGCLALGCVGLTTLADTVAKIEGKGEYETLAAAFEAVKSGDTLEIVKAGEYPVSALPGDGYTLKATVDGVKFAGPNTGYAQIAWGKTAGIVLSNVTWNVGTAGYQYWGKVQSYNCKFIGLLFCGQGSYFEGCQFERLAQDSSDYHAWAYGACSFKGCTFTNPKTGKFINVYNEGSTVYPVSFVGCKFINTTDKANKAALNVKATCGSVGLGSVVTVEDCSVEGPFPSASTSASLIVFNGVVQLDDIKANVPCTVSITQDGRVIYKDNAPIPEPITVTVEKNEEKGVTQDVVTEIAGNKEVGKLEETGLKEALPAEELEKGEPVIKVQLQEVAANTLKFDVSPYVGTEKVDSNTLNGKPVAVRLPLVAAKFDGEYAKVIHEGDPIRFVLVKKGATGSYVDLTLTHFSEIDVALVPDEEVVHAVDASAVEIQPGLWGANGVTDMGHAEIVYSVGATGLKAFRDWVNDGHSGEGQTFKLVADVDLAGEEWTPIAKEHTDSGVMFKGEFKGQGYAIYGLKITENTADEYSGLFGRICYPSVIRDLTLYGQIGDENNKIVQAGAFVGGLYGGGMLSNLTNYASVKAQKKVAGIVGTMRNAIDIPYSDYTNVQVPIVCDCVNSGELTGSKSGQPAAGIVAHVNHQDAPSACAAAIVRNCVNNGKIAGNGYVGGIVGRLDNCKAESWISVESCVNNGTLTGYQAGGIFGMLGANKSSNGNFFSQIYLTNSANLGNVSYAISGEICQMDNDTSCKFVVPDRFTSLIDQGTCKNYSKPVSCGLYAKIVGESAVVWYPTVYVAVAAAKAGDTVKLVANSTEAFTLPIEVTFDASAVATYDASKISAPEGYFVKEVSAKVYECRPAVVQIGTKIYSSLQEALAEVQKDETVKLLAMVEDPEVRDFHTTFTLDLNDFTLKLKGSYAACADLKISNGTIDITGSTGGMWVDNQWYWVFHVNPGCTFSFEDVTFTGTPGEVHVFQTAANVNDAVFAFKDCKVIGLEIPGDHVFANNLSKMTFDHCELVFDNVTGVFKNDNGGYLGLLEFTNGSKLTVSNTGRGTAVFNRQYRLLIDNSTVDVKNYGHIVSQESNVELANGGKFFLDGAKSHGITGTHDRWDNGLVLVVGSGCELSVSNCANVGINVCGIGSVFKAGSKVSAGGNCRPISVVVDGVETTWNPAAATYNGTEVDLRVHGDDLTIEKGAEVDIAGYCCVMSGAAATIADGRFKNVKTWNNTAENLVTVSLKGGIYKVEPADAFVNEAYEKVVNEDPDTKDAYPIRVQAKPEVASYETAEGGVVNTYLLEKAVQLVKASGKVTLLAPNAESFTTTRTEPFTLVTSEGKAFTGKITMPNGYALKDNGDGTYSYYKMPIATITREAVTTEYDSLPAACAAAQNGDTIVLSPMIIDATSETAIAGLNNKRVVVKGAGMDVTTLNWGTGKKTGPSGADFGTAEIMFQDLAFTVDHANGEPYKEHFKPMASLAFKGVKVNGMLVVDNDATFDGCTFTGPRYNSKTAADDEYLLWLYKGKLTVMNCTFPGTGTHAPIKLYSEPTMPDNVCALDISNCTFAVVGDQNGAIVSSCKHTTPKYTKDQVYDVQIDTDSITIPDGAYYVGLESGQWAAKGVTIINGTKDKNGKYVSGVVFSSVGEDADINRIVNLFIGPDSACLPYVGPETNLADFRWYIGDKQLTPKTDDVEVGGLPENPPQEMKDQVAADTNNVIKTLSGDDITKFADTDVAGSSFNADGNPKDVVKQTLIDAANEQSVKDAIAAQLGESNSNERVEIKLDKFDFTVQEASATLSVVEYDVKPWIKVTTVVDNVETVTEAVIPNSALAGHPLTFRLAVNSNFVNYAKVTHKDGGNVLETYLTKVFTGATGKYVQLKSDHFSNFSVSAAVTEPKCKVGDQFYNSVQEAIAENADVPDAVFTLTAPCSETGLALKWGQVIDVNGQEFSGAINPVDPEGHPAEETYEQAKTPDGLVFSAPKKIEVPTSPEAGAPKIKVRIAGMTADQLKAIQETSKRPLWADIVMGTSEKLIPFVPRSPIGSGTVTIKTTLPDSTFERTAATARDGVSVKYQLKKRVGNGDFLEYDEVQDIPVFTVDAAALEARTSWKIETIFDEEY